MYTKFREEKVEELSRNFTLSYYDFISNILVFTVIIWVVPKLKLIDNNVFKPNLLLQAIK